MTSYAVRNWFARTIAVAMSLPPDQCPNRSCCQRHRGRYRMSRQKWAMRSVRLVGQRHKGVSGAGKRISRRRTAIRCTLLFQAPERRIASMKTSAGAIAVRNSRCAEGATRDKLDPWLEVVLG